MLLVGYYWDNYSRINNIKMQGSSQIYCHISPFSFSLVVTLIVNESPGLRSYRE